MEMHFLKDLAIVMFAAGAMTLLCHRLKQPVVIGYLLAGLFVGPYTPPVTLVSDLQSIHTMAELGLVFLMFALGLEFNLPKIRKVGMSAGLAVLLEVAGMMVIGYALGRAFGWSVTDSIFLGSILCISSTTIIVKVFMDFKMMQERFAQVVFGILVLEDIVAVAILSILSGLGTSGGPDAVVIVESFLRIGLFVTLFLVLGLLIIPRFIQWVGRFDSKEVLGVVTLGLCLGGAWLAASFNFSIALGAFLMGAVLAASKEIKHIEEWIHPVRDMFSAVFFVSAGMLIQPALLWEYKIPIVIITAVTIMGKVLSGTVGSFVAGYDVKTSARVGMSLAQIGEFSFVIASLGLSLRLTSDFLYPLAVTVSSLTTLATPYLIRHSDSAVDFFFGVLPAPLRVRLDRVQQRREKENQTQRLGRGTSIFSKYLVRFGVYAALLVFFVLSTQVVSGILGEATASRAAL
jgi:CPA2 family monovalent cation:H+ antiporter-2